MNQGGSFTHSLTSVRLSIARAKSRSMFESNTTSSNTDFVTASNRLRGGGVVVCAGNLGLPLHAIGRACDERPIQHLQNALRGDVRANVGFPHHWARRSRVASRSRINKGPISASATRSPTADSEVNQPHVSTLLSIRRAWQCIARRIVGNAKSIGRVGLLSQCCLKVLANR